MEKVFPALSFSVSWLREQSRRSPWAFFCPMNSDPWFSGPSLGVAVISPLNLLKLQTFSGRVGGAGGGGSWSDFYRERTSGHFFYCLKYPEFSGTYRHEGWVIHLWERHGEKQKKRSRDKSKRQEEGEAVDASENLAPHFQILLLLASFGPASTYMP